MLTVCRGRRSCQGKRGFPSCAALGSWERRRRGYEAAGIGKDSALQQGAGLHCAKCCTDRPTCSPFSLDLQAKETCSWVLCRRGSAGSSVLQPRSGAVGWQREGSNSPLPASASTGGSPARWPHVVFVCPRLQRGFRQRRSARVFPGSRYHRITEWSGLAGPSVCHPAQPPAEAGSPRAGCTAPRPGGA